MDRRDILMAVLTDVGAYLDTNVSAVSLTAGTNLFYGRLPDSPDTCVALYETGGQGPEDTMGNNSAPVFENPRVQIIVRASDYASAETLIRDCWDKLQLVSNETLTSTHYFRINAVQSPFALERDSQDRMMMACNFQIVKTP